MLRENGLVVVWVTNKQKYLEFVRDELFPHWGLKLVAHWHWVKVCYDNDREILHEFLRNYMLC